MPEAAALLPERRRQRVHFVGVGGIGMSGLAQILLSAGAQVSGSDKVPSHITEALARRGARVFAGHAAEHAAGAELVVVSDAVKRDRNPEVAWALAHGVPVLRRSEFVGQLTAGMRTVAVAGTHGKTTTAAMLTHILRSAGLNPTFLLGGEVPGLGGNAGLGGDLWVVEACEAYESYLDLRPALAVITNIETDHLDHHGGPEHLHESFRRFAGHVQPGGTLVLCAERPELQAVAASAEERRVVWYALDGEADYTARGEWTLAGWQGLMPVYAGGRRLGEVTVPMPGRHNLLNSMAALAAALELGAGFEAARDALVGFTGIARRFERVGEANGITIVDDYAHHPSELRAALATAHGLRDEAGSGGRVVAVFQPHLFSRTQDLLDDFAVAFDDADVVYVAAIYPAREEPIPGVTSDLLVERLRARRPGKPVELLPDERAIARRLATELRAGDWAVILGAGSIGAVAWELRGALAGERA